MSFVMNVCNDASLGAVRWDARAAIDASLDAVRWDVGAAKHRAARLSLFPPAAGANTRDSGPCYGSSGSSSSFRALSFAQLKKLISRLLVDQTQTILGIYVCLDPFYLFTSIGVGAYPHSTGSSRGAPEELTKFFISFI